MFHTMISGNSDITGLWEYKLSNYVKLMPNGEFLNLHNDKIDHCCGIALLSSGDVVALYPVCTLNPLIIRYNIVKLTTYAVSNFSRRAGQTWHDAVSEHNQNCHITVSKPDQECSEVYYFNDTIYAYYLFDKYEDQKD